MKPSPTASELTLRQWPALAALVALHLLVLGCGFAAVARQVPLSLGQTAAIAIFLLLLALAELALLVLGNSLFEGLAARLPGKAATDLLKALLLAAAVSLPALSLVKFVTTRAHLRSSDLWFALTSAPQLLQESLQTELAATLLLSGGFLAVAAGLFASFRLLRRRPAGEGVTRRAFGALALLGLIGCAAAYLRYEAVSVFARFLVPEIYWLSRLGAGPQLAAGPAAGTALLDLERRPMEAWQAPSVSGETLERPNVVLIMLESVPWDRLGAGGGRPGATPHLDRLASESVVFSRAYSPSVHSDYAQMAILSSLYPRKYDHHDYYTDLSYPRTLLWDVLGAAGWKTAMFSCQNEQWGNMLSYLRTDGLGLLRHSPDWPAAPRRGSGSESKVFEETVVAAWREWLEEDPGRPFFAYLNFQATHFPYVVPPAARRPFAPFELDFPASFFRYPREGVPVMLNRFDNALAYVDSQVGAVIAALHARGEWDRTVLVVVSDHGEAFYQHGLPTHGTSLHEEQVRSLWLMRLPGQAPRRVDEAVSLLDVAPALVDALGLPPHGNFQGRGDVLDPNYRSAGRPLFATIQGMTFEDGVIFDGFKYTLNWDLRHQRLYDLAADPRETVDLAARRPETAARLRGLLGEMLAAQLSYYRERAWEDGLYPPALP